MEFIYILLLFVTSLKLVISEQCIDQQLLCHSYSLMDTIKQNITASNLENKRLINGLNTNWENTLRTLNKRLEELESENIELMTNLSNLQVGYQQLLDNITDTGSQMSLQITEILKNVSKEVGILRQELNTFQSQKDKQFLDNKTDIRPQMRPTNTSGKGDPLKQKKNTPQSLEGTIEEGPYGGTGGVAFTDEEAALNGNITAIHYSLEYSNYHRRRRLERLGMTYGNVQIIHGAVKTEPALTISLEDGEFIVGAKGCSLKVSFGITIYELTFQTNLRNLTLVDDKACTSGDAFGDLPVSPPYRKLAYISGRRGGLIDQITLHYFSGFESEE